jgi:hypothetical protein
MREALSKRACKTPFAHADPRHTSTARKSAASNLMGMREAPNKQAKATKWTPCYTMSKVKTRNRALTRANSTQHAKVSKEQSRIPRFKPRSRTQDSTRTRRPKSSLHGNTDVVEDTHHWTNKFKPKRFATNSASTQQQKTILRKQGASRHTDSFKLGPWGMSKNVDFHITNKNTRALTNIHRNIHQ